MGVKPNVELHIEELVLHGFEPGDRDQIAQAVERELARLLLAEGGLPPSVAQNGGLFHLDGGAENQQILPVGSKINFSVDNGKNCDNHGFARWVSENAEELLKLGEGRHYGEWHGKGIQRGYGLEEKRFSLFNVTRWCLWNEESKLISINPKTKEEKYQERLPKCCYLVPILYKGIFDTFKIQYVLGQLGTR